MALLKNLASAALRRTGYGILKPGDLERLVAERSLAARDRHDFVVSHPLVKGKPSVEFTSVPAVNRPDRQATARRLLHAYKRASEQEASAPLAPSDHDLWTNLVRNELGELLDILAADDAPALADYLLHFGEKYTWFGGLTFARDGYVKSPVESRVALTYFDKLICLAEAIGVLPVEHPEHGQWGENLYTDIDAMLTKMEMELGISIEPPQGAVFVTGIRTSRGVLHYRHLNAIYTAYLISTLAPKGVAVCEYGGGLGAVALYARRMRFRDYTLFDIPITNLFAGNFLINAIGSDDVTLFGEEPTADRIKVMPYWTCADAPEQSFELALNQDSFPEIDQALVERFLKEIRRTTRSLFLSINHEAQSDMTDRRKQLNLSAILKHQPGFTRLSRRKYWLREGYAEETYRLAR